MRVSKTEMEKSHQRIVEGASRLVRGRGIENTSVADVMAEAGMKNGGFYRHFDTKDAMVDAALQSAFNQMNALVQARFEAHQDEPEIAVAEYQSYYLSKMHVNQPGTGCPVAALGSDVARGPDELKSSFGAGVQQMIDALAKGMHGSKQERRARAAREFALLIGTVIMARASDPDTARFLLSACRKTV